MSQGGAQRASELFWMFPSPSQMGLWCLFCDNPSRCCVWLCCKLSFHVIVFPHFQMKTRTVPCMRHPTGSTVLALPCSALWSGPHPSQTTCMGVGADTLGAAGGSCSFAQAVRPLRSARLLVSLHKHSKADSEHVLLTPSLSISPEPAALMRVRPTSHCSLV